VEGFYPLGLIQPADTLKDEDPKRSDARYSDIFRNETSYASPCRTFESRFVDFSFHYKPVTNLS